MLHYITSLFKLQDSSVHVWWFQHVSINWRKHTVHMSQFWWLFPSVLKIVWPLHASKSLSGFPLKFPRAAMATVLNLPQGGPEAEKPRGLSGWWFVEVYFGHPSRRFPAPPPPPKKKKNGQDEVGFYGSQKISFFYLNESTCKRHTRVGSRICCRRLSCCAWSSRNHSSRGQITCHQRQPLRSPTYNHRGGHQHPYVRGWKGETHRDGGGTCA